VPLRHHLVTGDIPMMGFPVLGRTRGCGHRHRSWSWGGRLAPGDHRGVVIHPVVWAMSDMSVGMRNLCDLGAGLLGGAAVSDGTYRIQAAAKCLPHDTAGGRSRRTWSCTAALW